MTLLLLVSSAALVGLPAGLRSLGVKLEPRDWARLCAFALGLSTLLVHAALAAMSALALLSLAGQSAYASGTGSWLDHLAPGGLGAGLLATLLAAFQIVSILRTATRIRRQRARLEIDMTVGTHRPLGEFELVVLPSAQLLALSSPARGGQIIITDELLRRLDQDEAAAVVLHEAAHLRSRHHRLLWIAAVADAALPQVLTRRTSGLLRASVEQWADESAAGRSPNRRAVLRRAIERFAAPSRIAGPEMDDRLVALSGTPSLAGGGSRLLVALSAGAVMSVAAVTMGDWATHLQATASALCLFN